jgi:glutamine cyclotransferase
VDPEAPPVYTYRVLNTYPHDPNAFTQGLVFEDGQLYEGTGRWGESSLRWVDLETGRVLQVHELSKDYFGEGIEVYADSIVQLTWKSGTGFVYDRDSLNVLSQFSYETEGWGITYDGERLIVADGTARLYFWDPNTYEQLGQVPVRDRGQPIDRLNELEFIGGNVYANVWQTDRIAVISPATGNVVAWVDLKGLLPAEQRTPDVNVLNGIAYDEQEGRLFVTGKLWPALFHIELLPRPAS